MMIALIGFNANAAMYIVGSGIFGDQNGDWDPNGGMEMTLTEDNVYTCTANIDGAVWFVFADGRDSDWDTFNLSYRYGPTSGNDETVVVDNEYQTQHSYGSFGAYKFVGSGEDYVFTINPTTLKFSISGYVAPIEVTTYSVVGNFNGWNVNSADDIMTLVNGVYTLNRQHVELQAGTLQYKFIGNHDYGVYEYPVGMNNLTEPVEKHGYYDMTFTLEPETPTATCSLSLVEEIIDEEDPIYTVAGTPAALFGTEWAPALEENEMTKGQDGKYTWTKNAVELTAGTVAFKVVLGHDWGLEWPSSNYEASIEENGTYDVTITFDPETKDITFNATPVVVTDDFYTVAGSPAALFGEVWDPEYAANNMVLDAETGLYTWTKEGVALDANTFIEFKVVKNANWTTCWPASNYEYTVAEAGTYDVTITYNPENDQVILTVAQPGVEPEMVYTVVGPESVFGSDWDGTDENNDMVLGENGIYTWTKDNVTLYGNFSFKVYGNHSYEVYEWPMGYGNNYDVTVDEEGIYTITITFDPTAAEADRITCSLIKTGDVTPVEHVYTVAGTENLFGSNWDINDEANNMVKGEDGIYTWTKGNVAFAGVDTVSFKVVQDHSWDYAWPALNKDYYVTQAGTYDFVITFNAETKEITCVAYVRGDVDGNNEVGMDDLSALINYLLTGDATQLNEAAAAACDGSAGIGMDDLSALINYLLTNHW